MLTEVRIMPTSRNHQEAHGIGQVEEQLNQQANAADAIQGGSETDREITKVANRDVHTSLDQIIDSNE
jgi:ArsR family metal-binding transcriptional regulator